MDNGRVELRLQGACGSCSSSSATMKMGIERALREKFGDAVREVGPCLACGLFQHNGVLQGHFCPLQTPSEHVGSM